MKKALLIFLIFTSFYATAIDLTQQPQSLEENLHRTLPLDPNYKDHREALIPISQEELEKKGRECEISKDGKLCFEVGMIYYQGRNQGGRNLEEALFHLELSCQSNLALGCYEAGLIIANSKNLDPKKALNLFDRSCQIGDLRGCEEEAIVLYNYRDIYSSLRLFKQACDGGKESACQKFYYILANAYAKAKNPSGAAKFYKKSCELGYLKACKKLNQ